MNHNSKTKTDISFEELKEIINKSNLDSTMKNATELKDGMFNNSYLITLASGEEVVLKVAPSSDLPVLSYEYHMMNTEVELLTLVNNKTSIPLPKIIFSDFSKNIIPFDYFIMEKIDGTPLSKFENITSENRKIIYLELAKYLAEMHSIPGDKFGYIIDRDNSFSLDYFNTFKNMIDMLILDSVRVKATLPVKFEEINYTINKYKGSFTHITPVFVHFDLWDGNIFVKNMDKKPRISGLIDFERGFFGDPCADMSQVSGYINLEDDGWFIKEYNKYAKNPFVYGQYEKNRVLLYKYYLFLIMIIETYYRDVDGSFQGQLKWASQEFIKLHNLLN